MRLGWRERRAGVRWLVLFWSWFLLTVSGGAVILQMMGPPEHRLASAGPSSPGPAARVPAPAPVVDPVKPDLSRAPGRDHPGPIAAPDPALLEPLRSEPARFLPRVAADGRTPAQVYARGFDAADPRPRIGIVLGGVGRDAADSEDAVRTLPGGITLAVAPDAVHERLLDAARAAGHELLITLPLEGYRATAMGDPALLSTVPGQRNAARLAWELSQFGGYVGATSGLGLLRGAHLAGSQPEMTPLLEGLADRGLLYIDAQPGQHRLPLVWNRSVDLVIDEPAVRTEIDAKLAALEQRAHDKGSALGLAVAVRPVTVDRLAAWTATLAGKGLALAPVSALVVAPEMKDAVR